MSEQRFVGVLEGAGRGGHWVEIPFDVKAEVSVPAELAAAFADAPDPLERYERSAFTHRREYAEWVGEAKRSETRLRRAERAIEMLREGSTLA